MSAEPMSPREESAAGTKTVTIEYFARLREERGVPEETIETSCATPEELYAELAARHHFRADRTAAKVAVNDAVAPWDTPLRDGDRVVFLTPFGGG